MVFLVVTLLLMELQAAARCEQACFGGRVHGQDPCIHTLSKHCLSDVPPDRFSLAMYPLGGFAEAPLSSYLSDDFPLISRPRGLKTPVDVPFLFFSFGCDFLEIFGGQKNGSRGTFLNSETQVWGQLAYS